MKIIQVVMWFVIRILDYLYSRCAITNAFRNIVGNFILSILLIWAERKPIERRDVILLTAFPLVSGLFVDTIFAFTNDLVTWIEILLIQLVYIFLIVFSLSSYVLTRTIEGE